MRDLLVTFLFFAGVVVSPANGSTGDPIFFINGHPEPVEFSWSIPKSHTNYVVVTSNPHGKEVFFVYNNTQANLASTYKDRVKNLIFNHGNISFALENITKNDEGNYTCHEGDDVIGPVIPDCGQTLHYLVSPVVKINSSEQVMGAPGENLTLRCLVESASPDVPRQAYSWTFSPSGSSSSKPLKETGDTLTLGPLTRNNSGQYTCQARNDQDFKGRIPPGNATISLKVHSKQDDGNLTTSSPTSLPSSSSPDNRLAIGLGVGLTIVCIIVVAVIVIVVVAKRKEKCCFQPSGGFPHQVPTDEL